MNSRDEFILMSYTDKKKAHIKDQMIMQKPNNSPDFAPGDYVSIDRQTMTVYNHACIGYYNVNNLYGFVSYDEVSNNGDRDHIKIVRFSSREGSVIDKKPDMWF